MIKKFKSSKGFTLIELLVVIAILAILVLLAAPRFFGRTQEAIFTKHISNARTIQNASELYFMDEDDWPRLTDKPYTSSEIEAYAESIYSITGETIDLDPEGNYYDIDYNALNDYVSVNDEDKTNYILQNPVGKVYYLEGLSELGRNRVDFVNPGDVAEEADEISEYYVQAIDDDFRKINGNWIYDGKNTHVIIPHVIRDEEVTSYRYMFSDTAVEGVVSDNPNVTDMYGMFYGSRATSLDLSNFDTSNVTNMQAMFYGSSATSLDLSHFDTSNVTDMRAMFQSSRATTLDLSNFDTSNVTTMRAMFFNSRATTLDLSSFDTSNVTTMSSMFLNASARTGYARTTTDRDFFNNQDTSRPTGLSFRLK